MVFWILILAGLIGVMAAWRQAVNEFHQRKKAKRDWENFSKTKKH